MTRTLSTRGRWLVPVGVAAVVAAVAVGPSFLASASSDLPELTPQELLTKVAEAESVPLSGTVVYTARLGLPEIPMQDMRGAGPLDLLGGSSTVRVWTDGDERSRAALTGSLSEYSVVRDGPEAWAYSSSENLVQHYTVSPEDLAAYEDLTEAERSGTAPGVAGDVPTPAAAANALLAYAQLSTDVSVGTETQIAGRDAYQLGLVPRTDGTLVERVLISVDAETFTPLRVQVWSTSDTTTPAVEVGFTDVSFAQPDDAVFAFSAPPGSTTEEVVVPLPDASETPDHTGTTEGVSVSGTGWETVVELTGVDVDGLLAGDPEAAATLPGSDKAFDSKGAADLYEEFGKDDGTHGPPSFDAASVFEQMTTEVTGGRLLTSSLVSVLITDDGRVFAGAVPSETLLALAK